MLSTYVVSSNIDRVGFKYGQLFIQFKSGISYMYDSVNFKTYQDLVSAESVGKFFNEYVKKAYDYQKLDHNPFVKEAT